MKTTEIKLAVNCWPYNLEVLSSGNGLLLRSRRKARANWSKSFRLSRLTSDELASARAIRNKFDVKEWEW
jgi:hypothetical protein